MGQIINVTDKDFEEEVIKKSEEIPIVVDFWAKWCMPCHILSPTLEKFAEEYREKFVLVKVDVDQAPKISKQYDIMSIPTVKMFKEGKITDEFVGAVPEPNVRQWLDQNLG